MLKTLKSILPIHPLFFFSPIFTNSYELHGFSLQNYTQKVKVKKVKRRELKVLGNYEILYRNHYLLIKRREGKRREEKGEGAAGDWEWLFFLLVQECKSWAWRIAGKPFSGVQSALLLTFFFSPRRRVFDLISSFLSMKGGSAFCCSNVYLVMHIYTYFEQR